MCRLTEREFNAAPSSVPTARRWVKEQLIRWKAEDLVETVELLTSELITNAVKHGNSDPTVVIGIADGRLEVAVSDEDDADSVVAVHPQPNVDRIHGRGLFLVESLADEWGVTREGVRKQVWFSLHHDDWPYRAQCVCSKISSEQKQLPSGRSATPMQQL